MAASIGLASLQHGIRHPIFLAVLPYFGTAGTLVQDRGTNVFKPHAGRKVKFNCVAMAFVKISKQNYIFYLTSNIIIIQSNK